MSGSRPDSHETKANSAKLADMLDDLTRPLVQQNEALLKQLFDGNGKKLLEKVRIAKQRAQQSLAEFFAKPSLDDALRESPNLIDASYIDASYTDHHKDKVDGYLICQDKGQIGLLNARTLHTYMVDDLQRSDLKGEKYQKVYDFVETPQVKDIIGQIFLGIKALHEKGFVNGAMKHDTIFAVKAGEEGEKKALIMMNANPQKADEEGYKQELKSIKEVLEDICRQMGDKRYNSEQGMTRRWYTPADKATLEQLHKLIEQIDEQVYGKKGIRKVFEIIKMKLKLFGNSSNDRKKDRVNL